jgi:hypothetical protein
VLFPPICAIALEPKNRNISQMPLFMLFKNMHFNGKHLAKLQKIEIAIRQFDRIRSAWNAI